MDYGNICTFIEQCTVVNKSHESSYYMHASVKGKTLIEVKTIEITISEKLPEAILVMCSWPQGTRLGDILLSRLSS